MYPTRPHEPSAFGAHDVSTAAVLLPSPHLCTAEPSTRVFAVHCFTPQWERVKKVGMAPGARASFALSAHAHPKAGPRAFVFGGVSDNEAKVRFRGRTGGRQEVRMPHVRGG